MMHDCSVDATCENTGKIFPALYGNIRLGPKMINLVLKLSVMTKCNSAKDQ